MISNFAWRTKKTYGMFFWDTVIILMLLALVFFLIGLLMLVHPILPFFLGGIFGFIALIAFIRYKIYDKKWRRVHEEKVTAHSNDDTFIV